VSKNVTDFVQTHRPMIAVVAVALAVGLGAGYWLSRGSGSMAGNSDQPIEWNKVQTVPTRAPDVEDVEWKERSDALDAADAPPANGADRIAGNDTAALENASQ
jgi:hypothetical protein